MRLTDGAARVEVAVWRILTGNRHDYHGDENGERSVGCYGRRREGRVNQTGRAGEGCLENKQTSAWWKEEVGIQAKAPRRGSR